VSAVPATLDGDGGRPLRVAMVLPTLVRAGMEVVTARLAVELTELGQSVDVVCLEDTGPVADELVLAGVPVHLIRTPGVLTNFAPERLTQWFAATKPDVVHSHSGVWLKAARAAHLARVPAIVHTVHGLLTVEPWYTPLLMRLAARVTSRIIPVSDPLRSYLLDTIRLPGAAVQTVPNGVDTKVFCPSIDIARDRVIGQKVPGPVVGCVARFDPIKNHELLLEAFALVRRAHHEAVLVLVGDGDSRKSLEHRAQQPDLRGSVVFAGERRDTPDLYRCFDVVALTSKAEGTSMSILEAMATGCCVVATDVGGTGALLDRGAAGVLVPPGDAIAFADRLNAVLDDTVQRRKLGEVARARAVDTYSQRTMALRYLAIYRDVLCRASGFRPGYAGSTITAAGTDSQDEVDTGGHGDALWRRMRRARLDAFGRGAR
jgi:glycosyltransferase involved in cell wall biosynthesis